ncbi:hypothetical protein AMAG_01477 [Allomyces macrogynus ATCC 38327]|uniref:Uncharacterized protein n=1 Tax=Allomyces macrogynus (strain ATCC 38327) TaxID=578462 RepID=A0A0L0RZR9_ALLM3|nr:hypothetical protein AMAG_01477 [Allomyces macrogynus ATCC 38327]|eukprot:KNE55586.1 hypothetical protein AMAG_01477 [Allomyces macrogynus ATCC 38327]
MSGVPAPLLAFGVLVIAAAAFGAVRGLAWWVRQPSPPEQAVASTTRDVEKAPARQVPAVPAKTQLNTVKPMRPAICCNKVAPVPAAHVKQSRHDPLRRRPSAQEAARWSTAADVISSRSRNLLLSRNRVGPAPIDPTGGDKASVSRWLDDVPGPNDTMRSLPRSRSGPLPTSRMPSTRKPAPLAVPDTYMLPESTIPSPTSTATLTDAPGSRSASPFPMHHHSRTATASSMHSLTSAWYQHPAVVVPSCGSVGGGVYLTYPGAFSHTSIVSSAPALAQAGPVAPQPAHLPLAAWHSRPAAFAHPFGCSFV